MKRIHFWFGLMGVVAFLLTGQYMFHVHDHLKDLPHDTRMLFRSSHIYILLSSVINLVLGVYFLPIQEKHKLIFQYITSALLLTAPLLLLIGFFVEPSLSGLERPYSRIGIYMLFGSAVGFIYLGLSKKEM